MKLSDWLLGTYGVVACTSGWLCSCLLSLGCFDWYSNWFFIFRQLVPWSLFHLLLLDVWPWDYFDRILCLFPCNHLLHWLISYCFYLLFWLQVFSHSLFVLFLFSNFSFCLFHSFFSSIQLNLLHLFSLNGRSFCRDFLSLLPVISFCLDIILHLSVVSFCQDFCQELYCKWYFFTTTWF